MHYYQFNIGDYASHTAHLDPLEDIAYRRMLDWIYLHESPLPLSVKQISKYIRMRDECDRISDVINEFFIETKYGYSQKKADNEIKKYRNKSEKAKQSAQARWGAKPIKQHANALPTQSERNANQEPSTTNHEPLTKESGEFGEVTITSVYDNNPMKPPSLKTVTDYASKNNLNLDGFYDHYTSNGWKVGVNKMDNWTAAAKRWHDRQGNFKSNKQSTELDINSTGWS